MQSAMIWKEVERAIKRICNQSNSVVSRKKNRNKINCMIWWRPRISIINREAKIRKRRTDERSIGRHRTRRNEEAEEQRLSVSVLFIIFMEGRKNCGGDEEILFPLSSSSSNLNFYLFVLDLIKAMCGQCVLQPRGAMNLWVDWILFSLFS